MTNTNINSNNELINITIWIDIVPIINDTETNNDIVDEDTINQRVNNLFNCMHKYVYTNEIITYNNKLCCVWKCVNSLTIDSQNIYLLTETSQSNIDSDLLYNQLCEIIANKDNNWNINQDNINKPFSNFVAFLNKDKSEICNNLNCYKPYRIFFVEGKISNTIIRHYKIISTIPSNINDNIHTCIDVEIPSNIVNNFNKDEYENLLENYIGNLDSNYLGNHKHNIKKLAQNINISNNQIINYIDPIKTEDSIFESNVYDDYETFNDSLQSFSDELNLDDHSFENEAEKDAFINSILSTLGNNGYTSENPIYIRFAPKNEEKQDLITRILSIKGLYNNIVGEGGYLQQVKKETEGSEEYQKIYNEVEHFLNKLDNSDIPIYNDDRYYSLEKYKIVKELFEEKLQQEI